MPIIEIDLNFVSTQLEARNRETTVWFSIQLFAQKGKNCGKNTHVHNQNNLSDKSKPMMPSMKRVVGTKKQHDLESCDI